MVQMLAKYWWMLVLRGVLSILFGIIAFMYPSSTLASLILFFGIWMIVDGVFSIGSALFGKSVVDDWVLQLMFGILSVFLGAMVLSAPGVTALVLVVYAAVWFMIRGVGDIVFAIKLRKVIPNEALLILGGFLSLIVSFMLLWNPVAGALALLWLIALYAIIFGVMAVALGFKFRSMKQLAQ
jgi:uncharacterized membrane protein HdeD (DUF308 family)